MRTKSHKAVVKVMPPQEGGGADIAPLIREILGKLGEEPEREGLLRTPDRADKALRCLPRVYRLSVEKILDGALYEVKDDEMVVVKDIEFVSMCDHHMLPFFGKMHVAYVPRSRVI